MSTLFYIIGNIFRIYATYKFMDVFFKKDNVNRYLEFGLYTAYFAINTVMYLLYKNMALNIATNILPLLAITFIYKSSISRKFISTIIIYAVAMVIDAISLAISTITGASFFFSDGLASTFMLFLTALILKQITNHKNNEQNLKINLVYIISILLIPTGSIVIGHLSMQQFNASTIIIASLLFLIDFLVFFLYDKLLAMLNEKNRMNLINQMNEEYANQLEIMYQSQQRIRFIKHDMENHIFKMQNLLEEYRLDELWDYFDNSKEYIKIRNLYVSSGNSDVDSLLNYRLFYAESIGVVFDVDVKLPEKLNINNFDLNIILGNLLGNALEALDYTQDKLLKILIKYHKGVIKIDIQNTFDGIVLNNLSTRKEDKENHGLGLLSVQTVLDKYNGLLKTSYDEKWFEAAVIMYEN